MKHLSYKAIARMAGYRVGSEWKCIDRLTGKYDYRYDWYDVDEGVETCVYVFATESAAWKECCLANDLIDED